MLGTSLFSIGCMKRQHAVILEPIWERDSIIIISRLTYGTPYSSSDLLYFTLLLPFTWTNYFKSNSLSPFRFLGQKYSKSNFHSTKIFWDNSKFCLSRKIIPILQKNSKTISNLYSAAKSFQFYKIILSLIFFLTKKNSLFLPTNSILLPLESKQCSLTIASVLACADPTDEIRFWSKSGS